MREADLARVLQRRNLAVYGHFDDEANLKPPEAATGFDGGSGHRNLALHKDTPLIVFYFIFLAADRGRNAPKARPRVPCYPKNPGVAVQGPKTGVFLYFGKLAAGALVRNAEKIFFEIRF